MSGRKVVLLVGLFRAFPRRNPGRSEPGGYVDALAGEPYGLGAACLKAYADSFPRLRRRYDLRLVHVADRSRGAHEEALLPPGTVDALLREDPFAVCFSAYCWSLDAALRACAELKRRRPSVLTVLGGRSPDSSAAESLALHPCVDMVLQGEAERPFVDVLTAGFRPVRALPGVSFRRHGRIFSAPPAPPLADLDRIPSPYLSGVLTPPPDGMMMELSRGCPNDCGYCAWNSAKLRRAHSRRRMEKELRWAVARGVTHVALVDSAVNYETDTLRRFARARAAADPEGSISFTYNLRHERLDRVQARLLAGIPSAQVLLGLETLSAPALRTAGRRAFDRRRFERALRLLRDVKPPSVGVILGLPGDTPEGFRRTLRYLVELSRRPQTPVGAVLVSLLQVFPGTPMHREAERLGLRLPSKGIPYLVSGPGWGESELKEALLFLLRLRARTALPLKGPEGAATILRRMRGRELAGPVRTLLRRSRRAASAKARLRDILRERFPFLSVERHESGSYVPEEVLVRVTSRCGQRCPFCSAPEPEREPSAKELELSFRAAERLFPGAQFTLTGGEPTSRRELPEHVRLLLRTARFSQVRVQTNGVAFAKAAYVQRYAPDPRLVFFVSLHALEPHLYDELTGTRGQLGPALAGLRALIGAGHRVIVNIVLNDRSVGALEAYAARLARLAGTSGRVQVHFSVLSCPEHRPGAVSYLVRYKELVPRLMEALRILEGAGVRAQSPLSSTHASFPPCAVPPQLRREGVRQYRPLGHETGYEDFSRPYVKARRCRACAFDRRCLGLPRAYAERFGLGDCRPVRG